MYTFAPNRLYCAKMSLFIISQDCQTQVQVGDALILKAEVESANELKDGKSPGIKGETADMMKPT